MDSLEVVPCKEKEEVVNQHMPSAPVWEATKEENHKEPERKKKHVPTILQLYAMEPHTRPNNKLQFKFKLMENP